MAIFSPSPKQKTCHFDDFHKASVYVRACARRRGARHSDVFIVFALLPDSGLVAAREHGSGG